MVDFEKDEVPMLSDMYSQGDEHEETNFQRFSSRNRSASMSISRNSMEPYENGDNFIGHTGPLRNERRTSFIQMSGPLYISRYHENLFRPTQGTIGHKTTEPTVDKYHSFKGMDQDGWPDNYPGKNEHLLKSGQLGVCNDPYCTTCPTYYDLKGQKNNSKSSVIFDPKDNKCIVINWPLTTAIVVFRSMTDFIYFIHILLQIIILLVIPRSLSGANFAKNLLRAAVLVQYIPRLYRFLPLMVGQSPSGFTFESAWANFVMNLLTFVLSGHVVGSCWYLFGLQRVNQCLRNACRDSGMQSCTKFIDCGHGNNTESFKSDATWTNWTINENATACFNGGFSYGIYVQAVNLTTEHSIITRYIYSFFWGFQQISTLAGNQIPSYFVWEILFTTAIIGLGLLLFALLIGNMQNFLQALGRRRLEMSLRRRDVEQWMSHRRLPEDLKRQVRQSERYNWAATRGVNEEMLLENLPEDLQRDIRRHLFKFVKKVRIFALMDEPILDAICERLRQRTYIEGSKILYRGGPIEKMAFIVRGKMESIGEEGIPVALSEGDVCGEELLAWCLEHSSLNKGRRKGSIAGQRLLSNRMVRCFTNVEAFTLRAADIEEVTNLFSRFLRNPRVQGAIRYESPYWRGLAARRIQVAWRYRKKRLNRADTANSEPPTQSFI